MKEAKSTGKTANGNSPGACVNGSRFGMVILEDSRGLICVVLLPQLLFEYMISYAKPVQLVHDKTYLMHLGI